MARPIENKPWTEKVLNILQLLDGIFDLLKKISWRILSFFIVYLALVGYTALDVDLHKCSLFGMGMRESNPVSI